MDGGIRIDTVTITPEILKLIAEIDEFKGAWTAIGRISPERLTALRRVATIESIGSSTRIEGAKLSNKEVEQLLTGLEMKEFVSPDEEEVAGYAETMETLFAHWQDIPLTENHIKQLHRGLLQYSSKPDRFSRLAALADLLPQIASAAKGAAAEKHRARALCAWRSARTFDTDS